MTHLRSPIAVTAVCLCLIGGTAACSSNENGSGGSQTGGHAAVASGGQSSIGGSAATGGSSNVTLMQTGGASAATTTSNAGGQTSPGSGTATGGNGTGTTSGTGGSSAANTGTTRASGGLSATGGSNSAAGGGIHVGGTSSGTTNTAGSISHVGGSTSTTTTGTHVGGTTTAGGTSSTAGGGTHTGGTSNAGGTSSASTATGGSQAGASSTPCASRVLSLSANGTGSTADTAYAHVEVDLKTDLPIGNAARTFEFWAFIKTTDWVGEKNEVYYYGGSASAAAFGLDFGTNPVTGSTTNHATLNPFTGGGFNDDSTKDLGINSSSDQWVHIAMTWDQTALRTYVNGLPKIITNGSSATTALSTAQSALIIGCNPSNNNCFNGNFSEFRVWNLARSDAQIKDSYDKRLLGSEAGLVGYWRFDDAPGAMTAADSATTTGHTAHPGTLKADSAAHNPTFVAPTVPVPLTCP